jgi:hypothetical protein
VCVHCVCAFITAVPIIKLFAWGEGDSGGHVLRETTSCGQCGLFCPSRTSEHGGEGDCVKEGGGEEGERKRERALELLSNGYMAVGNLLFLQEQMKGIIIYATASLAS